MRRWLEVLLVLVCVAVGARLFVSGGQKSEPAELEGRRSRNQPDTLGGFAITGASPFKEATAGYFESPEGVHMWGMELTRDGQSVLHSGDPRDQVLHVLGKPVGFNSDNSKWGYWTRGLPNSTMGILVSFNGEHVGQIDLHENWGRLAADLTPVIPKKR